MSKILIMAGHSQNGHLGSGAAKYINESNETRRLGQKVVACLKSLGVDADYIQHDKPKTKNYLKEQVDKANAMGNYDCVVQIHFNAGSSDPNSNTTGTETYYRTSGGKAYSDRVNAKLSTLFKNRGSKKDARGLYWLKNTRCPAILIEVCFVDDKDDADIYLNNIDKVAQLIAEGIADKDISNKVEPAPISDSFLVKIIYNGIEGLNIRQEPNTSSKIMGQVYKGQVFTIVEIKNGFYKLKSGKGWISGNSKYVKKF